MVTAEIAVALPALVLVLALGLSVVAAVTAQQRCADAAQVAARLLARGETAQVAVAAARRVAPAAASVDVSGTSADVVVVVAAPARLLGLGRWLPAPTVHARFVEAREPGTPAAAPAS